MLRRRTPDARLLIAALGCAQVVSWGTLYYGFSLFVLPMAHTLGWSLTLLNGALSAGLMVAGLCAYPVGAFIDRHGGRALMTSGSIGAAVLLVVWSQVTTPLLFYLLWLVLGACLATVLYEPVFIVLTQHFGTDARHAITTLTLIAGFASTIGIPFTESLLDVLPWRDVLLILAALNLLVCAPIHWVFIPPGARTTAAAADGVGNASEGRTVLRERLRNPVFWGLALWFTAYAGTGTGLVFQLVPSLKSRGVASNVMLTAIALIGPSQVLGRLVLLWLGQRTNLVVVGALTTTLTPLAVLVLVLAPPTLGWLCLFACFFGVANGITTILRGIAPPAWLGHDHVGKTMGAIGTPMLIVSAFAPLLTAAIWSATGDPQVMQWAVFAIALCGAAGFWFAVVMRTGRGWQHSP